jgi:hypothetical protein
VINHFHKDTPEELRRLLSLLWHQKAIVRVVYGDTETGRSWLEEHDVVGYIGSSAGPQKIPLIVEPLVYSRFDVRGDSGGPGLLDHCILCILSCETGRELYRHPKYVEPRFGIEQEGDPSMMRKGYTHCVVEGGGAPAVRARFKSLAEACAYVAFHTGHLTHRPFRTVGEKNPRARRRVL